MRNRDSRRPAKIAERQTALAGARPFHRVPKLVKSQIKVKAQLAKKVVTL